jgi:hypothetical protein
VIAWQCLERVFFKNLRIILFKINFFIFSDYFDVIILKIFFKKTKKTLLSYIFVLKKLQIDHNYFRTSGKKKKKKKGYRSF